MQFFVVVSLIYVTFEVHFKSDFNEYAHALG